MFTKIGNYAQKSFSTHRKKETISIFSEISQNSGPPLKNLMYIAM